MPKDVPLLTFPIRLAALPGQASSERGLVVSPTPSHGLARALRLVVDVREWAWLRSEMQALACAGNRLGLASLSAVSEWKQKHCGAWRYWRVAQPLDFC